MLSVGIYSFNPTENKSTDPFKDYSTHFLTQKNTGHFPEQPKENDHFLGPKIHYITHQLFSTETTNITVTSTLLIPDRIQNFIPILPVRNLSTYSKNLHRYFISKQAP